MKIKSKNHPLNEYFYLIEHKNEVASPFTLIPLEYILEHENEFNNAFLYLEENHYSIIKEHKSIKAMSYYLKKHKINKEEQAMWIKTSIEQQKRLYEIEDGNLDIIAEYNNEFACEILLSKGHCVHHEYKNGKTLNLEYIKQLALNDFKYLEELALKSNIYKPYILKWFYNEKMAAVSARFQTLIEKQHKMKPDFYTHVFLNVQPPRIYKEEIDLNMATFLNDFNLLSYLFSNYGKHPQSWLYNFFRGNNRKISDIREFILDCRFVPDEVSEFMCRIIKFINFHDNNFEIFFDSEIDYKKYHKIYDSITSIDHEIIINEEKMLYFMIFSFYRRNFHYHFDPLNYKQELDTNILRRYCYNRSDIEFYLGLSEEVKNTIDPIYYKSSIMKAGRYPRNYFKSFQEPGPCLLHTKLGILFIQLNLDKFNEDQIYRILTANKMRSHELNEYIDKFIWDNCKNKIHFIDSFKNVYDTNLANILLKKPSNIDIKIYLNYKDCKSECINHLLNNKSVEEIISYLHYDEAFITDCLKEAMKVCTLEKYKFLFARLQNKKYILSDLLIGIDDIDDIIEFLLMDFEQNKAILFDIIKGHIKYFKRFVTYFNNKCSVEDAKGLRMLKDICTEDISHDEFEDTKDSQDRLCYALAVSNNPHGMIKDFKVLEVLLLIHDFYEPYMFNYIDQILQNCGTETGKKCLEIIFKDKFLLFSVHKTIKEYLKGDFNKIILDYLNNEDGYFTHELFALTKTISYSDKAYKIIKTTKCEDFVKMNGREMVDQVIETTFEYYFDEVLEGVFFYKLREILHDIDINKVEIDLGKKALKIISSLEHICLSNDYLDLSVPIFKLLNDDRFLDEIINIFEKWALVDKNIIEGLIDRLEQNNRISKVLVSILCKIEKEEPEYVDSVCNKILIHDKKGAESHTISRSAFNFIAYAPALRAFKNHRDDYINILKDIYLTKDYEIAERAFVKMFDDDIKRFIIDAAFNKNKRFELLSIVSKVIENNKEDVFFCCFYLLKFEKTEKIRHKANELWITHFKGGLIRTVLDEMIVFLMYSNKNRDLFELCVDEILDKYDELLGPKIVHVLESLKESSSILQNHLLFHLEPDRTEIIKNNVVFILHRAIRMNKFVELALEYSRLFIDESLIKELANKKLYIDKVIDIILQNKLEYEFVLQNSVFIDKIYTKTNDSSLIPFLSDPHKMKVISKDNVKLVFQNFKPNKEWEHFLTSQPPAIIYEYLNLMVPDFNQLKTLVERVFNEYENFDDIVDIYYINYIKDCTFKNVRDHRRLLNVLLEGKAYRRIDELSEHLNDDDICHLLKLAVSRNDVRDVIGNIKSVDMVLCDYLNVVGEIESGFESFR